MQWQTYRRTFIAGNGIGWALALFSTVASSIVTPLVRGMVVGGMEPIGLLLLRLLIAVLLLAATLLLTEPGRLRIDRRGVGLILVIGLISGVEICCFFWSLSYVGSSMSAMLKSTQPLVVLLLLALGGERLTGRHFLRLGLAMAGVYLLVGAGAPVRQPVEPFGLLLLGISLILYALQLVLSQWWLADYDIWPVTLYLSTVMTGVIALWWWAQGAVWPTPDATGWLVIGVLALVSTYLARLALYAALPRVGSGQIALLWPLQTLLIILLSVLYLGERMTPVQWVGGALVLASALLTIERIKTTQQQGPGGTPKATD